MQVQPYLFFNGKCEEALEYYKKVLGAKVGMTMRFGDVPDPQARAAAPANNIMHSEFQVGETTIMASDGMGKDKPNFQGFSPVMCVLRPMKFSTPFVPTIVSDTRRNVPGSCRQ